MGNKIPAACWWWPKICEQGTMRFTKSRSLAAISAAIAALACFAAQAAPPRYGGTLHVRLGASSVSLDPGEWTPGSLSSAASEKLASLVYDRLVTLDDYAKFQPALATEWLHDAAGRNWQFRLRPGVRFSDGSVRKGRQEGLRIWSSTPQT